MSSKVHGGFFRNASYDDIQQHLDKITSAIKQRGGRLTATRSLDQECVLELTTPPLVHAHPAPRALESAAGSSGLRSSREDGDQCQSDSEDTVESLRAMLRARDQDLHLAAEIGQGLLEENVRYKSDNETLLLRVEDTEAAVKQLSRRTSIMRTQLELADADEEGSHNSDVKRLQAIRRVSEERDDLQDRVSEASVRRGREMEGKWREAGGRRGLLRSGALARITTSAPSTVLSVIPRDVPKDPKGPLACTNRSSTT